MDFLGRKFTFMGCKGSRVRIPPPRPTEFAAVSIKQANHEVGFFVSGTGSTVPRMPDPHPGDARVAGAVFVRQACRCLRVVHVAGVET